MTVASQFGAVQECNCKLKNFHRNQNIISCLQVNKSVCREGNIAGLSLADTEAVDSVTSGVRAGLEVSCLYSRKGVVSVGIPENFRTSEGGHQHNWPE